MLTERLASRTPPIFALALAVVAVSTSAILIRESNAPSIIKALYRILFTIVFLAPWALGPYRATLTALTRRDTFVAAVTGIALAVHFAVWFESLEWTSVAASVTLVQSQPLFVAVGAYVLLDERIGRLTVVGILLALAGMAGMTLPGAALVGARPVYGNALAVAGAVMAACYVLAGRSLRQRVDLVPYVMIVYVACAVSLFAFSIVDGAEVALTAYPPREWILFAAMAIGPGLFGHTVINWTLRHVESSVVSVALLGEPVGSAILAVVFLSEVPSLQTVVGGAVVLAGIYLTVRSRPSGT